MNKRTKILTTACAAALLTIGASMSAWAASGWQSEDGTWRYYTSSGDIVTNEWKKSGNDWFWLDDDGYLLSESLVEDDDDYYYVNEAGAMVKNEWHELDNEDADDDEADTCWYYFAANGKAYTASNSGKTTFKTINSTRYAFDEEGKMLYGWVDESSNRITDDDAWRTGIYYLGEEGDGALRAGQWQRLEVDDDDSELENFDGYYWFYFNSNGKKVSDTTKTINGRKYRFSEDGYAIFNWYVTTPSDSTASDSDAMIYYNEPEECWQSSGWFQASPDETLDPDGYEDGDTYWYYAQKDGEILKSQIKKINGYYYAFDEYGKMLEGLYKMCVNDREIQSYEEIESESDLPDADDGYEVYYFGSSPKDGVMKTGTTTLEIDGESYYYYFIKTGDDRGAGYNGIYDGCIYIKGQRQEADKDEKLTTVEYEGETYLVNTSGKIQKKKTNTKDADDNYYCTDASGIVTYVGTTKWSDSDD